MGKVGPKLDNSVADSFLSGDKVLPIDGALDLRLFGAVSGRSLVRRWERSNDKSSCTGSEPLRLFSSSRPAMAVAECRPELLPWSGELCESIDATGACWSKKCSTQL